MRTQMRRGAPAVVGVGWLVLPFVGGVAIGLAIAQLLEADRSVDEQGAWRDRSPTAAVNPGA